MARRIPVCVALLVALQAGRTLAQVQPGTTSVGPLAGYYAYSADRDLTESKDLADRPGSSAVLGVRAGHPLGGDRFGAEATLSLAPSSYEHGTSLLTFNARLEGRVNVITGRWLPFVVAGPQLSVSNTEIFGTDADLGLATGGGLECFLDHAWSLRADGRWLVVDGVDGPASDLELTAGVAYAIGAKPPPPPDPDSDGDGLRDSVDKCPGDPEDVDGFADDDGCVDADHDTDGLPDGRDACPDEAEDKNGYEDEDGCPDGAKDGDGDGVPDVSDSCRDAAEDADGFEDADGCPDTDNDKDGKPDADDKCRDTAESVNGFEDGDGCPDEVPAELTAVMGINLEVRFAKGGGKVGPAGRKALLPTIEVLARYPGVGIVVGATAHRSGDDAALSQARAESVRAYFVKKGLDAGRLKALGLGDKPLPDGAPDAARRDRVELRIAVPAK